jgi:hypothetical protein
VSENLKSRLESAVGGYGIIPRSLMRDSGLSVYEKVVLAYMLSFTGAGNSVCFPSQKTMREEIPLGRTTLINTIKSLCEKGLLSKSKLYPKNSMKQNNKYELLLMSYFRGLTEGIPKVRQTDSVDVSRQTRINNSININSINNTVRSGGKDTEYTQEFLEFWDYYPRKLRKKEAFQKWKILMRNGIDRAEFDRAVTNYVESVKGKDEQYILHPATFLGPNERWRDYV